MLTGVGMPLTSPALQATATESVDTVLQLRSRASVLDVRKISKGVAKVVLFVCVALCNVALAAATRLSFWPSQGFPSDGASVIDLDDDWRRVSRR